MVDKIFQVLQPLNIPVSYVIRPALENTTEQAGISYHFFLETGLYGDGVRVRNIGQLQVDYFYRNKSGRLRVAQIVKLLERANLRLQRTSDDAELVKGVRLYHMIIVFNYDEQEVLRNG